MREFSYQALAAATDDFSVDHLIGKGSHGAVYKATLTTPCKLTVAIKKPSLHHHNLDNEIAILSSLASSSPKNIVTLIGISCCPPNLLVTEFMPNGSLYDLLHANPPPRRRLILIVRQIADALLSLHESGIVHRDVKSENILLDRGYNAKLADFSLAVWVGAMNVPAAGTFGYLDPGYSEGGKLSVKNDVFSFGVVVLEVVSGRRVVDVERAPASIVDWARGMVAMGRAAEVGPERVVGVAMRCVGEREELRPTMREVVEELRGCLGWRRWWRLTKETATRILCKNH